MYCDVYRAKWQKKRTTRITRTGLSKNNVTLIILNMQKLQKLQNIIT